MALISLAFAAYMVPGLWGAPLKAVSAFAPPMKTQDFSLYTNEVHPKFTDYDLGMQYAKQNKRPVMVDFTGYGCVNCRKMEAAVWTDSKVSDLINNDYVLITLYVDEKQPLSQPITVKETAQNVFCVQLAISGVTYSELNSELTLSHFMYYWIMKVILLNKSYAYNDDISKYIAFLQTGFDNYKR
jgi:Protein of unknown function, DUF255.